MLPGTALRLVVSYSEGETFVEASPGFNLYKFLVFNFVRVYDISFLSHQLITDSTKRGFGVNHRGGFTLKCLNFQENIRNKFFVEEKILQTDAIVLQALNFLQNI